MIRQKTFCLGGLLCLPAMRFARPAQAPPGAPDTTHSPQPEGNEGPKLEIQTQPEDAFKPGLPGILFLSNDFEPPAESDFMLSIDHDRGKSRCPRLVGAVVRVYRGAGRGPSAKNY